MRLAVAEVNLRKPEHRMRSTADCQPANTSELNFRCSTMRFHQHSPQPLQRHQHPVGCQLVPQNAVPQQRRRLDMSRLAQSSPTAKIAISGFLCDSCQTAETFNLHRVLKVSFRFVVDEISLKVTTLAQICGMMSCMNNLSPGYYTGRKRWMDVTRTDGRFFGVFKYVVAKYVSNASIPALCVYCAFQARL